MKIFSLIYQKPLRIKYYTSKEALMLDELDNIGVSRSTLEKWDFTHPYVNSRVIIHKGETKTTGDIRKEKNK